MTSQGAEIWVLGPLFKKNKKLRKKKNIPLVLVDGGIRKFDQKGGFDLWVGDGDSAGFIPSSKPQKVIKLNVDKNESDLERALFLAEKLWGKSQKKITYKLFGFLGGELDHQIGVFAAIDFFLRKKSKPNIHILGEKEWWALFRGPKSMTFPIKRNKKFSVFSPGGAKGIKIKGSQFDVEKLSLPLCSRGLSNVAKRSSIEIQVKSGTLWVRCEN